MKKSLMSFFAIVLIGTQAGAEGCGGKADPGSTPGTQPAAAPPPDEGRREPVPAPADPKPHDKGKPDYLRDIFFDGDGGQYALVSWGLQPGQLTRERIQLPAKRGIRIPASQMTVLIVDAQLESEGTIKCRVVDRETGSTTSRASKTGIRAYITCLEEFVTK
jgi:hypothetical protein